MIERAIEIAARRSVPVLLNPAPARPLSVAALSKITYFIPNESETALYAKQPVSNLASAAESAAKLRKMGAAAVILTLGSQGALLHTDALSEHIPAFPVTPVDTTAAGDAFVAGFAVAAASGESLPEAVRFAAAVGALATTKPGAQPSLPELAAVEKLLTSASFPN